MTDIVTDRPHFEAAYDKNETPWDSNVPSVELCKALDAHLLPGKTVLGLGCGTGTNAIELARRGYEVTGVDYVARALDLAREKAARAAAKIDFRLADLTANPELGGPYDIIFDRGVYHSIRKLNAPAFFKLLARVSRTGTLWLSLAGNAKEQSEFGPPRVHEHEFRAEIGPLFDIVDVHEFHFETASKDFRPLAWAILSRRK